MNLTVLCFKEEDTEIKLHRLKENFMSLYDTSTDGRLQIQEVSSTIENTVICSSRKWLIIILKCVPLKITHEFIF